MTRPCPGVTGARLMPHDFLSGRGISAAFGEIGAERDRVDILVTTANRGHKGVLLETSEEDLDAMYQTNVKSVFHAMKAALPLMLEAGGAIVNVGSIVGIRYIGVPYISYSATKGAVLAFTRSIAVQYADRGIRANTILPGLMNTPMIVGPLEDFYADGDVKKMIEMRDKQCPTGTMGDAWDVAYAALYLASDEAKYVNGAELVVDGGLTCRT